MVTLMRDQNHTLTLNLLPAAILPAPETLGTDDDNKNWLDNMFKRLNPFPKFLRYPLLFRVSAVYLSYLILVPVASAQVTSACDYSNAAQFNGWGWNSVAQESCTPVSDDQQVIEASVDDCDYSNADSSNSWGWNPVTLESCAPVSEEQPVIEPTVDNCDYSNAGSFNGWGWNPVTRESCAPINEQQPVVEASVDDCDYSNADSFNGWGWNPIIGESCAPIREVQQVIEEQASNFCNYSNADTRNEWGWNLTTQEACPPASVADGLALERVTINALDWPESGGSGGFNDISANGRYITFSSSTLSPSIAFTSSRVTPLSSFHLYVRDTVAGVTRQLLPSPSSVIPDGFSGNAAISADGRFVAFTSDATNLTAEEDTNGVTDVFVIDLQTNVVTAITHGEKFSFSPDISHNGRYVSFSSEAKLSANDQNNRADVYVHDRLTGNYTLASVTSAGVAGNRSSVEAKISGDGRFVLFESRADDLGLGDRSGFQVWHRDVFQHDLQTGETRVLSADANGAAINEGCKAQGISANGSISLFICDSVSLAPNTSEDNMFIYNQETESMSLLDIPAAVLFQGQLAIRASLDAELSDDGRYVVFNSTQRIPSVVPENIYSELYVYRHDRVTNTTEWLASDVRTGGISADGRFFAFESNKNLTANDANEFSDIFIADLDSDNATSLSNDPLCTTAGCTPFGIDWVWDGDISDGVVTDIETLTETFYEGADCVDLDGDGFGWQLQVGTPGRSCLVQ